MSNPNRHAPNANPAQPASLAPFDLEYPWQGLGYPEALMPLLYPSDPWPLAEAAGVLHFEDELRRASQDADKRRQRHHLERVRELLGHRFYSGHTSGWQALSSAIRMMPAPSLPDHILRPMPVQAASILSDLWSVYRRHLLKELWERVTENPQQDWRLTILYPPFPHPDLDPAPVPPSPVEPAPDLWLAWIHPTQGTLAPVLVRSVNAPRPLDTLELTHTSGWTQAQTVVECSLALDRPEAEPIIGCLAHHQQGVWEDTTREQG